MGKFLHIVIGFVAGIACVLSCGDDHPSSADAAACDCPASEPPLNGRITEVIRVHNLPPSTELDGRSGEGLSCPPGGVLITGGCTAGEGQAPNIVLEQSNPITRENGRSGNGWECNWRNNTNQPVQVRVIARCLVPAP